MANYHKCPACGNKQRGAEVYKCRECGRTFCAKCGETRFGDVCPKCDIGCPKVGVIG